jgi:hypothetical protein
MTAKIPLKTFGVVNSLADRQLNTEFQEGNSRSARRNYNRHCRYMNNAVAHIEGQHLDNLIEESGDILKVLTINSYLHAREIYK